MDAEQFIEENYYGLKIDCPRDILTIYQALEDYAKEQLRLYDVSQQRELLITALKEANRTGYLRLFTKAESIADKVISGNL